MFEYRELSMRLVERDDLAALLAMREDPEIWAWLGDVRMLSEDAQERWFETMRQDLTREYYIVDDFVKGHEFVGLVRSDEIDWINRSMRVGCDVRDVFRGQGYGTRIMHMVLKYCFDYLNMHRLWLLVLGTNDQAIHLYRNVGFRDEGLQRQAIWRDGAYRDYVMMSILAEEWRA